MDKVVFSQNPIIEKALLYFAACKKEYITLDNIKLSLDYLRENQDKIEASDIIHYYQLINNIIIDFGFCINITQEEKRIYAIVMSASFGKWPICEQEVLCKKIIKSYNKTKEWAGPNILKDLHE